MGHRLTRITTRTGDDGTTGLADGTRLPKDHPRIEALGAVDELNAALGLVLAAPLPPNLAAHLAPVQHDLFELGAELSLPDGAPRLTDAAAARLEEAVIVLNADLPPLREFVLPGGGPAAAACHVARTVCRRAERRVVTLARDAPVRPPLHHYLNRLSDLLFVLARAAARHDGVPEPQWRPQPAPTASNGEDDTP